MESKADEPLSASQISLVSNDSENIATFIFIDLETTGLSNPKITELSMVALLREHLLDMCIENNETIKNASLSVNKDSSGGNIIPGAPIKKLKAHDNSILTRSVKRNLFDTPIEAISNGSKSAKRTHSNERKSSTADVPTFNTVEAPHIMADTSLYKTLPRIPRVTHKLVKFFNPWKIIHPEAEKVSHLNNMLLESSPKLAEDFCTTFKSFLNFPKPMCLVAHNGIKFDFPIIMSEFLSATDCKFSFDDIYCVDSLDAVRLLDKISIAEELNNIKYDDDSLPSFDDSAVANSPDQLQNNSAKGLTNNNGDGMINVDFAVPGTSTNVPASFVTPPKSKQNSNNYINFPENCSLERKIHMVRKKNSYNVGFPKNAKPFSQPNLFYRLFGKKYVAHHAEDDSIALLQICGHYGHKFTDIADYLKKPMSLIKPKWINTKMLKSSNFNHSWKK